MAEKKFRNLKSHDCNVLMTELLPVVLRGILLDNVRLTIVKICAFLNAVSQKIIDPENLIKLQNDVVQCLVGFELIFPPSFFNIMTHLLVHLVKEIDILGPVFLHNMFPFERFMGYSRNVFVIELVQKKASLVPTKLRRSLTFVLPLLMTLNRLESLNRDMRETK